MAMNIENLEVNMADKETIISNREMNMATVEMNIANMKMNMEMNVASTEINLVNTEKNMANMEMKHREYGDQNVEYGDEYGEYGETYGSKFRDEYGNMKMNMAKMKNREFAVLNNFIFTLKISSCSLTASSSAKFTSSATFNCSPFSSIQFNIAISSCRYFDHSETILDNLRPLSSDHLRSFFQRFSKATSSSFTDGSSSSILSTSLTNMLRS